MTAVQRLAGRTGIVLDTMLWIYLFEDHPQFGAVCEQLVEKLGDGFFGGVVTAVTAAELLVKPLKQDRADIADSYRDALRGIPNLEMVGISPACGFMAGALRARYGLPLPDMIQAAVALQAERPMLVTNDKALCKVSEVDVVLLEELLK